ncbi:hypothetical protein HDR64_00595 [bacterium]|nr:hypothetical protein [bacterium]
MPRHITLKELEGIVGDAALEHRLRSNTHTPGDAEWLDRAYQAVFKQKINRHCVNCLYDALILLRIRLKNDVQQLKSQLECHYRLKAGVVLRFDGNAGTRLYTNANLTDDIAERWLRAHPDTRHYFSLLPETM